MKVFFSTHTCKDPHPSPISASLFSSTYYATQLLIYFSIRHILSLVFLLDSSTIINFAFWGGKPLEIKCTNQFYYWIACFLVFRMAIYLDFGTGTNFGIFWESDIIILAALSFGTPEYRAANPRNWNPVQSVWNQEIWTNEETTYVAVAFLRFLWIWAIIFITTKCSVIKEFLILQFYIINWRRQQWLRPLRK